MGGNCETLRIIQTPKALAQQPASEVTQPSETKRALHTFKEHFARIIRKDQFTCPNTCLAMPGNRYISKEDIERIISHVQYTVDSTCTRNILDSFSILLREPHDEVLREIWTSTPFLYLVPPLVLDSAWEPGIQAAGQEGRWMDSKPVYKKSAWQESRTR